MPRPVKKPYKRDPKKIYYSRGFPYGAPLVRIRGGGTYEIREYLKAEGFRWNKAEYAWESYMDRRDFGALLAFVRDDYEMKVEPKRGMDANYILDLDDDPYFRSPDRKPLTAEEKAAKVENAK